MCIFAHRSAALVIAIMGILKAGATCAIIDPAYPTARQITYLKVAQPKALIVLAAAGVLQDEVKGKQKTKGKNREEKKRKERKKGSLYLLFCFQIRVFGCYSRNSIGSPKFVHGPLVFASFAKCR